MLLRVSAYSTALVWRISDAVSASLSSRLGRNWKEDIPRPVRSSGLSFCLRRLAALATCTGLGSAGHGASVSMSNMTYKKKTLSYFLILKLFLECCFFPVEKMYKTCSSFVTLCLKWKHVLLAHQLLPTLAWTYPPVPYSSPSISTVWLWLCLPGLNAPSRSVTDALQGLPFGQTVHCQYVAYGCWECTL